LKVLLVGICTICGRISPASLGSAVDRRRLEELREITAASLMGAETLRVGNPEMRGRDGRIIKDRTRAIITGSGRIPVTDRRLFAEGPPPLIFTNEKEAVSLADKLSGKAEVIGLPAGRTGLSVAAVIAELSARGAGAVLLEGGGRLNYAALREGVVDEIMLTIAPCLSGNRAAASLVDGTLPLGDPTLGLTMLSCEPQASGEIFVRYRVKS